MATIGSTTKDCIPITDTRGYKRKSAQLLCAHAQAQTHSSPRAGWVPSSQTYALPTLDSASAFWNQGIQPYLCSCCSSCSFAQVAKWICLEFRLILKKKTNRQLLFINKWRLHQETNPKPQGCFQSFSCAAAWFAPLLLPVEAPQPLKYCCTQPCFLRAQMFQLPLGIIGLWWSPAVALGIEQQRGSRWPKPVYATHSAHQQERTKHKLWAGGSGLCNPTSSSNTAQWGLAPFHKPRFQATGSYRSTTSAALFLSQLSITNHKIPVERYFPVLNFQALK